MLKFGPQNIVLFGNGVFTEAIKLKQSHRVRLI